MNEIFTPIITNYSLLPIGYSMQSILLVVALNANSDFFNLIPKNLDQINFSMRPHPKF